VACTTRGA